ncbi:hypothetical protein K8P10_001399 [Leucobacter sp. Psy1]|uniref:hypothetical protein n=1 Tax=Leucobacter sp. Psy1 TaxID=2875729 RepID=UPI001CD3856F|nr:hypothetical protein [Leucobacter sp. Psy1]UBH05888.1 hypothetical protein K8P10_001399 [Leucobacter sp. Psy1]
MREIAFDLRRNRLLMLAKTAILSVLALTCFHALTFTLSVSSALHTEFSTDSDVEMYSITDTLADPEIFSVALGDPITLTQIGRFLTEMEESQEIEFLSAFDQSVPIIDFAGDETFDYGYGTDMQTQGEYVDAAGNTVLNTKSLQMTEAVFDFYGLAVSTGEAIDWSRVDYDSKRLPVLLGASYDGIYALGDVLRADFYLEQFEFEVVGFLEERSSIYFHGDRDTYLDTTIVVPYPADSEGLATSSGEFGGILTFAMLSGDIAAPRGTSADGVLRELHTIADRSGFHDFTLLNAPAYLVQYAQISELLNQNRGLVLTLGVTMLVVGLVVIWLLSDALLARRREVLVVHALLGRPRVRLERTLARRVLTEHAAAIAATIAVASALPNRHAMLQLGVLGALVLVAWGDVRLQRAALTRTPLHETEVA